MIRSARSTLLLAAAVLSATACASDEVLAPIPVASAPSLSSGVSMPAAAPWAEIINGETGPGALYELRMPQKWNGAVIYYAHGFNDVGPAFPLALPFKENIEEIYKLLGEKGYAVAASSFSENGFALKDGVQRTHQLRGLFTSRYGNAAQSYLMGHSLGGAIVVELAEEYPAQYDGALAMCGMVGGSQLQIDYLSNVRAGFDAAYPGVLRGDAVNIPADLTPAEVQAKAVQAMTATLPASPASALGAIALTRLLPNPVDAPPGNVTAAIQGTLGALLFHVRGGRDVLDHTRGHNPFGNLTTDYIGGFAQYDGAFFNTNIKRFEATADARKYLEHWFEPSGDLRIPVMTLHTMWDPAVPTAHVRKLAKVVEAAGRTDFLKQRTGAFPNLFNHCGFPPAEVVLRFDELVAWAASIQD
jgi:pimeloyl-ACP methyl ester carboxylesterase